MENDALDRKTILDGLGPSMFSRNIVLLRSVDSTNLLAKDLASEGAPEGTLVLAEEQTAGRGRMERRWLSPGYKNLLFSVILRPSIPPERVFVLTMILSIAVIDGIRHPKVMIKWPNDLYIGNRKLGGILTEFSVKDGKVEYAVLGLGLNVNWNPGEQAGLLYPATSIQAESGRSVSRNGLLVEILHVFIKYYEETLSGRTEDLYRRWNDLSMVLGREVTVDLNGEILTGRADRIDRSGALLLKDGSGREHRIWSGDVSVRIREY